MRRLNSQGFTLLETIISIGLSAIILYAAVEIQVSMTKLQNSAAQKENFLEIKRDLKKWVSDRCGTILTGQQAGTPITLTLGAAVPGSRLSGAIAAGFQIDQLTVSQISLIDDPNRPNNNPNTLQSYLLKLDFTLPTDRNIGVTSYTSEIPITARLAAPAPSSITDCAVPGTSGEQCLNLGVASTCPINGLSFAMLYSMCERVGLGVHFCSPDTGGFRKAAGWIEKWRTGAGPIGEGSKQEALTSQKTP